MSSTTIILIFICVLVNNLVQLEILSEKCPETLVVTLCRAEEKTLLKSNAKFPSRTNNLKHLFQRQIIQTIALFKSIMLTSRWKSDCKDCLNIIVVASSEQDYQELENAIIAENWDAEFSRVLNISFVEARYPAEFAWMKKVYRTCATLKLFLPTLLPNNDAIIYVDTDFLFIRHWSYLWQEFSEFRPKTIAGLVPEWNNTKFMKESYNAGAYNTGLMLMNLTRMREGKWTERIVKMAPGYLKNSSFGDQDIIIGYFVHFPEQLIDLPCHWNFAPRNHRFAVKCAETTGISAVHGLRRKFFSPGYFNALFKTFLAANLSKDLSIQKFFITVQNLLETENSYQRRFIFGAYTSFIDLILKGLSELDQSCNQGQRNDQINGICVDAPDKNSETSYNVSRKRKSNISHCNVTLAITLCEDKSQENTEYQFKQALTLIKSIIITHLQHPNCSNCTLILVVTNNMKNYIKLNGEFMTWRDEYTKFIQLIPVVSKYPAGYEWMTHLFKPCATLRLFYPAILEDYPQVIHVDTDIIFLESVENLWKYFDQLSNSTVLAVAPQPKTKTKKLKIMIRQSTSYQAGIVLMNLTQMRATEWTRKIGKILKLHGKTFFLPVQSTLEEYSKQFPGEFLKIPCYWNYLPHYCTLSGEPGTEAICEHPYGLSAMHGVNASFYGNDTMEPVFKTVFETFTRADLRGSQDFSMQKFVKTLELNLNNLAVERVESPCSTNHFRNMLMQSFTETWIS